MTNSQHAITFEQIIGTWFLLSHGFETSHGIFTPTSDVMTGMLIYSPDNSMSVLITKKPDVEKIEDIIAYSGTFSVEPSHINHHIQISPNPKRVNTTEKRIAEIQGDLLVLSTVPNSEGRFVITWKRS